jgi:GT2 family glycosyltransferase
MSVRDPILSFVVVVYAMPDQAKRTLYTLSPAYQRNVDAADYEVIVVENESPRLLGASEAESSGPNVRYFRRDEGFSSPVFAANFGAAEARGRVIGLMVDGARLLSPGVVELALLAHRAEAGALVSVPGYHLGSELQQRAVSSGYDESVEGRLLSSIAWPEDGYRLFDIACFSGSCAGGFFLPYAESNCLCLGKDAFERLGGLDERFVSRGGGYVNLDFYVRATELSGVTLFVTPGEGTFHQFHGGITTGGIASAQRERLMEDIHDEYKALRGHAFAMPQREAVYLGRIPPSARRFVEESVRSWARRAAG